MLSAIQKQNHANKATQKPLKHQKAKRSKKRKIDEITPTTYKDDITTTKHPLSNL